MSYFRKSWGCAREPGLETGSGVALKPAANRRANSGQTGGKSASVGIYVSYIGCCAGGPPDPCPFLGEFVAKKIPLDTLDRTPEPDEDPYRHA